VGGADEEVFEDALPSQNSTDEEKMMSTRSQSLRMGGGSSPTLGSFSLENRYENVK
jgi:hypothetical protein